MRKIMMNPMHVGVITFSTPLFRVYIPHTEIMSKEPKNRKQARHTCQTLLKKPFCLMPFLIIRMQPMKRAKRNTPTAAISIAMIMFDGSFHLHANRQRIPVRIGTIHIAVMNRLKVGFLPLRGIAAPMLKMSSSVKRRNPAITAA